MVKRHHLEAEVDKGITPTKYTRHRMSLTKVRVD
jgi:hypothetical protein